MPIWFVCLLGIAGVWMLGDRMSIPPTKTTTIGCAAVLAACLLWQGSRAWRARWRARALERSMAGAAPKVETKPSNPAVTEMQRQIERGIRALKESTRRNDAIATIPWYVIVGPAGVGKTTALLASGINPILDPVTGGGLRGVAGTRTCEWFFSNDAIILDTAGRLVTDEADRDEWLAFLDGLRENRPDVPINGIVVAIGAPDLVESNLDATADQIRRRLHEITSRMHVLVPVYVMVTKMDLVAGFMETFEDATPEERKQPLGFAFEQGARLSARSVPLELERILSNLQARLLAKIGEVDPHRRLGMLQFPVELAELRPPLERFCEKLLAESLIEDTPRLCGCYFTSCTQQGDAKVRATADRWLSPSPQPRRSPSQKPRDFFVRDVWNEIVFEDPKAAEPTEDERRRRRARRYASIAACASSIPLAAFAAWLPTRLHDRDTRPEPFSHPSAPASPPEPSPHPSAPPPPPDAAPTYVDCSKAKESPPPWCPNPGVPESVLCDAPALRRLENCYLDYCKAYRTECRRGVDGWVATRHQALTDTCKIDGAATDANVACLRDLYGQRIRAFTGLPLPQGGLR